MDPDDEFDDWIDRLHGFLHFVNPVPYLRAPGNLAIFANTVASDPDRPEEILEYADFPRSKKELKIDRRLALLPVWFQTLRRPDQLPVDEYESFVKYATQFFYSGGKLWRKHVQGSHQVVLFEEDRVGALRACHDNVGHRGIYATKALLLERFWWPSAVKDVAWYVKTCHICQTRQTRQVLIPPVVATPAPLFSKVHIDTMHLPKSGGFGYIVQARCVLTFYPEAKKLRAENSQAIGDWIYEDLLCRWGGLREIVTDNGQPFLKALEYLEKRYHIHHIRISGYNSRANGVVERPHFDFRQALYKAADGDAARWSQVFHSVLWSERITIRRRMGCSPYFAVTGSHPLIPLDIIEATYLQPPPSSILSSEDLIVRRAIALQKRDAQVERLHSRVLQHRIEAARCFERDHAATIRDFNFKCGDLVLVRNTKIEKSLNCKMRPRYLGPLITVSRNRGGAYILAELDGTLFDRPFAAFRVIPYLARKSITLPEDFTDVDEDQVRRMEEQDDHGDDEADQDPQDEAN